MESSRHTGANLLNCRATGHTGALPEEMLDRGRNDSYGWADEAHAFRMSNQILPRNHPDPLSPQRMKKHLLTVASVAISAVSAIANVYVSDGNSILKFTPDGTQSTFAAGLSNPQGLAFGNDGNLYVVNAGNDTISKITPDEIGRAHV